MSPNSPFFYLLYHANVLHFLINAYCLWVFRPRMSTAVVGYVVAVVTYMMPICQASMPTIGASAFCFACIARKFASWRWNITEPLLWNAGMLLLNLIIGKEVYNWKIHITAFLMSYTIWRVYYYIKKVFCAC